MDVAMLDRSSVGLPGFADGTILDALEAMTAQEIDRLGFGVIRFDGDGCVDLYNAVEAALAGFTPARILGRHMFEDVAPCMDNETVAGRFDAAGPLDVTLPYVLTLRMRPTPVRLRLLRRHGSDVGWVLVDRSARA